MLAILPTRNSLRTFREMVSAMSNHDYDLVEAFALLFKAMEYWEEMEDNVQNLLDDYETLFTGNAYAEDDNRLIRAGIEYLYREIRQLLDRLDVRDSTGFLRCKFHGLQNDDLIIDIEQDLLLPKDMVPFDPKLDLSRPAMDPPPQSVLDAHKARQDALALQDSEATLSSTEVDFMRELENTTPLRGVD